VKGANWREIEEKRAISGHFSGENQHMSKYYLFALPIDKTGLRDVE
jgi:hypothetical protein